MVLLQFWWLFWLRPGSLFEKRSLADLYGVRNRLSSRQYHFDGGVEELVPS